MLLRAGVLLLAVVQQVRLQRLGQRQTQDFVSQMVDPWLLGFDGLNVFLLLLLFALLLDAFVLLAVHGLRNQLVAHEHVGVDAAAAAAAPAFALLGRPLRVVPGRVLLVGQVAEGPADVDSRQVLKTPHGQRREHHSFRLAAVCPALLNKRSK